MRRRGLVSCLVVAAAGVLAAQAPARTGAAPAGVIAVTAQNTQLLRSWDATVEAMRRDGDLVLSRTRVDTVLSGRTARTLSAVKSTASASSAARSPGRSPAASPPRSSVS